MLRVKWESDCTKVSLHRMFLHAPQNVMQALACYIQEGKPSMHPTVKAFIEKEVKDLDYSAQIDPQDLDYQGNTYNLMEMYNRLNREYFNDQLKLKITWFGERKLRKKNRITFGLYCDPLKLIKISRFMDTPYFPDFVVSYIIYHEMLHNSCPPYIDEKGINRIHNKAFKLREAKFYDYHKAKKWLDEHRSFIFK